MNVISMQQKVYQQFKTERKKLGYKYDTHVSFI